MGQVQPVPRSWDPPAPSLPEPLIEEILVRIATPRDLIRASAACTYFRRLVANDSFLRRYRILHPSQLLLGILSPAAVGFLQAEAPNPNASVAKAFDRKAVFSLDYLPPREPSSGDWSPRDARDGRLLIMFLLSEEADFTTLPELVVADPLTRGCTMLPPIPESIVAPFLGADWCVFAENSDAFFDPSGDYEDAHFRVIGWTRHRTLAVAFVYSSHSGTWTAGTRAFWSDLGLHYEYGMTPDDWWLSYVYGCFYWKVPGNNKLLKLDVNRMEFSAVGLPPNHELREVAVAEAGEGRFGIVIRHRDRPEYLRYSIRQNEGEISNEHLMETAIMLPSAGEICNEHLMETTILPPSAYDKCRIVAVADGYIFLLGYQSLSRRTRGVCTGESSAFYTLEIKTLKVERFCWTRGGLCSRIVPYFGFPPFMSLRRI
ncbi:unnamed protein product [Urochloa decumbens]|uniref:F-box domain-containing protein n=1 Tax=Urochloa decumbens TaxID=240449 RepID=A0ABC8W7C8_9POAL